MEDRVNHPAHYALPGLGVEGIDVIKAVLGPEGFRKFCRGCAMKYLIRADKKGGAEDLQKARVYINWELSGLHAEAPETEEEAEETEEPEKELEDVKASALWKAGLIVDAILDELRLDGKAPTKAQFVAYMVQHPEEFQERR